MRSIYSNKLKFSLSVLSDLALFVVMYFVFVGFFMNIAPLMENVGSVVSVSDGKDIDFSSISSDFVAIMSGFKWSAFWLILGFLIFEGLSLFFVLNIVRKVSAKVFVKKYLIISLISLFAFIVLYSIFRPLNLVSFILDRNVYYFGLIVFALFFYLVFCYLVAIPHKVNLKNAKVVVFILLSSLLLFFPFWILAKFNAYSLAPIVLIIVLILVNILKVWTVSYPLKLDTGK